jgi:putative ABC transport system permease protein
LKSSVLSFVGQAFVMFDVLSLIGLIIGALGVINTMTMNVLERTRELGSLRALGMTRGQVIRMVLAEALTLSALGGIYGVLFGYIISKIFVDTLVTLTGYEVLYLFTPGPFLLGLLVIFAVSQVAAFGPARRAARINIVEALKHE